MGDRLEAAEEEFVRWQRVARLATIGEGGAPHNVPICPLLHDGALYFTTGADTAKVRNIQEDRRVALVFDEYTEAWDALKQVLVQGRASLIGAGDERFGRLRGLLCEKYVQFATTLPIGDSDLIVEVAIDRVVSSGL